MFLPGDHSDSDSETEAENAVHGASGVSGNGNSVMGNHGARTSRIQVGRIPDEEDWENADDWEGVRGDSRSKGGGLSAKAGIILVRNSSPPRDLVYIRI